MRNPQHNWCGIYPYKRSNRLVIVVSLLIFFLYVNVTILVLVPWLQFEKYMPMIVINVFGLIIAYLYYEVCSLDPGTVPSSFQPVATEEELILAKTKKKEHYRFTYMEKLRFCKKCNVFKPNRTHHCKCCQRCVLKMDHHCPFINKCVGYKNHKIFIMFLFYVTLGMSFAEFLYINRILRLYYNWDPPVTLTEGVMILLNVLLLAFLIVCTFILFANQIFLISRNMTKIELWAKSWAIIDARDKGQAPYKYPYDKGILANFKEFFGESYLDWIFPSVPNEEGTHWPHLVEDFNPVSINVKV